MTLFAEKLLDKTLPFELKSLNKTIAFGDRGKWANAGYKKKWKRWVNIFVRRPPQPVTWKVRAEFIRLMRKGQRPLDKDNLYGASKPIRDALKQKGWFRDDSPKWLQYECTQMKSPDGKPGTRIIIYSE